MKKLAFLALLLPVVSFGQRFDVTEQAGWNTCNGLPYSIRGDANTHNGFSNQVSVGYHLMHHIRISALYEYNALNSPNNNYGLSADFTSKYFYAGADVKMANFAPGSPVYLSGPTIYNTAMGLGAHVGAEQRLYKQLYLTEQIGFSQMTVKGHHTVYPDFWIGAQPPGVEESFSGSVRVVYGRLGLSYRF